MRVVQMLTAIPARVRACERVVRKMRANLDRRLMPTKVGECVTMYEYRALTPGQYMQAWSGPNVNGGSDWAKTSALEWLARARRYLWQFISCSALPI